MAGWLVVNHFLNTGKFSEIYEWIMEAAKANGMFVEKKTNAGLMCVLDDGSDRRPEPRPDFVIFWDKDVRLAEFLELKGLRLFNSARAIAACDDKSLTHMSLYGKGIRMPKTVIAPKTFENIGYTDYAFLDEAARELGFPVIVKECFGSFGQWVYMACNYDELLDTVMKAGSRPLIFQEFMETSRGRDIRIQVVGGRPVAAMYRYSVNGDFRANVTNGARMKAYTPNDAQVEMAVRACELLGLDFAGVDILFGENDEPVLCEVNSNAHFKNIYDCTGVNVADHIMRHIKRCIEAR